MKTRERLLFMALGGLLVLAGMIVGQFVFSTAQAQDGAQDATFKTVKCEDLIVGNSLNPIAVIVGSIAGNGCIRTFNKAGHQITVLSVTDSGHGLIQTLSRKSKTVTSLSASTNESGLIETMSNTGKKLVKIGSTDSGGSIGVNNTHGVKVVNIQANKNKDGAIGLFNRYGDLGWSKIGKR